jgi:hypothetical protein
MSCLVLLRRTCSVKPDLKILLPLALIIFLSVACWDMGPGDYKIVETFPSPNGRHRAILWTGMGGGAAGWCSQRISIKRMDAPFDLQLEKKVGTYVFSASCSSEISVEWSAEREVLISYTMDKDGVSVYQKPRSVDDSDVKISYLMKTIE